MGKISTKIPAILITLLGVYLLYPKIIKAIPRIKQPLPTILLAAAVGLIFFAFISKKQRGLIFPGFILLLCSQFLLYRKEPFFPSFLNGIIILPLIIAFSFLALLPFEPEKRRVIIPVIAFFAMAGIVYFFQTKLNNILKHILLIEPIQALAILLILWGIIRFFKS